MKSRRFVKHWMPKLLFQVPFYLLNFFTSWRKIFSTEFVCMFVCCQNKGNRKRFFLSLNIFSFFQSSHNLSHATALYVGDSANSHADWKSLEPWDALAMLLSWFQNRCSTPCQPLNRCLMTLEVSPDPWKKEVFRGLKLKLWVVC